MEEIVAFVSSIVAYIVEIIVLLIFAIIAIVHGIVASRRGTKEEKIRGFFGNRNSVKWFRLAVTAYASTMGNWVLFIAPLYGAEYAWAGSILYVIALGLPLILLTIVGPIVRKNATENDFTGTDFVLRRYGWLPYTILTVVSVLLMFVYLCVEMTNAADTMSALTKNGTKDIFVVLPIAVITLIYTSIAGLRASIFTDQFQGIGVFLLAMVFTITIFVSVPEEELSRQRPMPGIKPGSWVAGFVMLLGIYPSELLNQGHWQRVFAAKSTKDLRIGYSLAVVFMGATFLLFAYGGMLTKSLPLGWDVSYAHIFALMNIVSIGWRVVVLILGISLATSTIDTMQSGMSAVMGNYLVSHGYSPKWARLGTLVINIPALVVGTLSLNILKLLTMANFLCVMVVAPNIAAYHRKTTKWGIVVGCFVGLFTMLVVGWIRFKTFVGGFVFLYPEVNTHVSYVIATAITPVFSLAAVVLVSFLENKFGKKTKKVKKEKYEDESITAEVIPKTEVV